MTQNTPGLFLGVFCAWSSILCISLISISHSALDLLREPIQEYTTLNLVLDFAWKNWQLMPLLLNSLIFLAVVFFEHFRTWILLLISSLSSVMLAILYLVSARMRGVVHGFPSFPISWSDYFWIGLTILIAGFSCLLMAKHRRDLADLQLPWNTKTKAFFLLSCLGLILLCTIVLGFPAAFSDEPSWEQSRHYVGIAFGTFMNQNKRFGDEVLRRSVQNNDGRLMVRLLPDLSTRCYSRLADRGNFKRQLDRCFLDAISNDMPAFVEQLVRLGFHKRAWKYELAICCIDSPRPMYYFEFFRRKGINFDGTVMTSANQNPAFAAALNGNIEVLEFLKGNGFDLFQVNRHGLTPLDCARKNGQMEAVRWLEKQKRDRAE